MQDTKSIDLRIIFNSSGDQTIEAVINDKFSASCAGGTSMSSFESKAIDPKNAIRNFDKIKKSFIGDFDQQSFDSEIKRNQKEMGSILTTAISLAFFEMDFNANSKGNFPNLLGNIIGGGEHSYGRGPEIQEILTIPKSKTMPEAVETNTMIWKDVKEKLKKLKSLHGLNAEAAWTTDFGNEKALEIVREVADKHHAKLGIDFAASSIFRKGRYFYRDKSLTREKQIGYAESLAKRFDLIYMEDPMEESDFSGFEELQSRLKKTLICGDDLISSDSQRLKKAIGCIKAVIVKPNQIGTISDCLELMKIANRKGISCAVSHRSKETCCPTIAKLALKAEFAKFGVAGIRTAKLNELIRLWDGAKNPTMAKLPL